MPHDGPAGDAITTLDVDGESARIVRDEFGIPHVFADTNSGLFTAYGYVVAQDRLWQLEINRRASQGRLADIFGKQVLSPDVLGVPDTGTVTADVADQNVRTLGYTDQELDEQFTRLPLEQQEIFAAYVTGINRYLSESVAANPLANLPFEFHHLALPVPDPWTIRDAVRVFAFIARLFGDAGGTERANQTLLTNLVAASSANGDPDPASAGLGMFNDLRWFNDPEAPTSVPGEGAIGKRQHPVAAPQPSQLTGASADASGDADERAKAAWQALGIPTGIGSYGWTISATKSATGFPLFLGAPGLGFNAPEVLHEVQLTGGNGFHVTGATIAGLPILVVGRTDRLAWTLMTAAGADNVDIYVETLCDGGAGYLFDGVCAPYVSRIETIAIKGSPPITLVVRRSVHGPVVGTGPSVRFTRRRGQWGRELEDLDASLGFMRARSLEEFSGSVERRLGVSNLLYADNSGNIVYWLAGWIPQRAPGFDSRFPLPGDGSAEWTNARMPVPTSVNPVRGWLVNWNSKPSVEFDSSEGAGFGKTGRILDIEARLEGPSLVSPDDMRDIVKDLARMDVTPGGPGLVSRLLKPYLLAALDAVPPANALAPEARSVLEHWDGSLMADALTSTSLEPGYIVFNKWRTTVLQNTFGDELKTSAGQATVNTLLHALDNALREGGPCADLGGSCVPPSRDYFNGVPPYVILSHAFDQALAELGVDPSAWSNQPRASITFRHSILGLVAQLPGSARMTWVQHVMLTRPANSGESILTLGQSGFIGLGPDGGAVLDPHFIDQLPLYRVFQYKPMPLYRNWVQRR